MLLNTYGSNIPHRSDPHALAHHNRTANSIHPLVSTLRLLLELQSVPHAIPLSAAGPGGAQLLLQVIPICSYTFPTPRPSDG